MEMIPETPSPARKRPRHASWVGIAGDLLALAAAAFASYFMIVCAAALLGADYVHPARLATERAAPFAITAAALCALFLFRGHYHLRIPFWEETRDVVLACVLGLPIEGFVIYAQKADVSRLSVFLTWFVAPSLLMWVRTARKKRDGGWKSRAVVFGREAHAERASSILSSERHMGVDPVLRSTETDPEKALALMSANQASLAVIALSCEDGRETALVSGLRRAGADVCVVPPAMGMSASMNVRYLLGEDAMILVARPEVAPNLNRVAKRLFDIAVASFALAVLALPMAAMAAAIALDGGSPFFSHPRVGRGGRTFACHKFRSMRPEADAALAALLRENPEAAEKWRLHRKLVDDPRVTRLGRFIRKTSIDELPQLINVIKGEMSLVGPRPITRSELERYGERASLYAAMKPGVTGLWQVSGRSDTAYGRRVELDAWYVENWSPWHDIAILAKTVPAVLARRGAI